VPGLLQKLCDTGGWRCAGGGGCSRRRRRRRRRAAPRLKVRVCLL
jgi:hypothetical protein